MTERANIRDRLAAGTPLVLDGAMGSELQRRGVWVSHGATPDKLGAWSATAMRDAPDMVREIHEDYFRAGADIATTNSFWTNSIKLALAGLAEKAADYTRLSGEIAVAARDRVRPQAYVAGGMAPPAGGRAPPDPVDLPREFAMQAQALKEAGVDLLLLEYIGYIEDIVTAIDAVEPVGLPVMVGIRHVRDDGTMQFGETYDDLAAALGERKVDALLLMCSSPQAITAGLPKLRQAFSGPIGAYPNIGYHRSTDALAEGRQWHALDTTSYSPPSLARDGATWLSMGAQIVGGCCGTTPEHIAALRRVVPQSDDGSITEDADAAGK
jgi:S-methylmethionine-dependent homocysteine/selenocysteine methylase